MKVLSLFDGIACGLQALKEINIKVDCYYASEIDNYAISVAKKRHPEIIHLGDINNWKSWNINWADIDLIIGGSPCQGFSFAGKRLNFSDERSKLFFCFVDILNYIKSYNPEIKFLLENVKMQAECRKHIDDLLGVKGVNINSNLFSAQNRERIYWTNIQIKPLPNKSLSVINDIIIESCNQDEQLYISDRHYKAWLKHYNWKPCNLNEKAKPLLASYFKQPPHCPYIPYGDEIKDGFSPYRRLSPMECERLQNLPDNYTLYGINNVNISNTQRYKMLGNGWTIGVIKHILRGLNIEKITLESFAELAKQMRHTQRRYRRFGKPETLESMERLEAEFDKMIAEILEPQPKLF